MADAVHCDIVIVGAGPAGLAAAGVAAGSGASVVLLDANERAGGQVWRHDVEHTTPARIRRRIARARQSDRVRFMARTAVVAVEGNRLLLEQPQGGQWLSFGSLILATGARELLLPFPGWTLPGVTGAGGLQALAKQGWPLAGRRVVIAGSGPLLLAAAATARRHGAHVLGVFEQAVSMHRFAAGLWRWPGKAWQAAVLRGRLAGVPYRQGSVVTRARGDGQVREVDIDGPHGRERLACDLLGVGYGLVPDVRLAQMLGCRLERDGAHPRVAVDTHQRSSRPDVYAAGEACGIGGRDSAWLEGAIAACAAIGATSRWAALQRRRRHARAFAAHLHRHFALDARIRSLAERDTTICRCEDVPMAALDACDDARAAKLASRCGMGACQGRICGTALAELGRFMPENPRPPLFPVRLETLAVDPGQTPAS
ncbi:MAG TPA: FAD/NAD(P)-binding oxidoreductase [Rhodanobacteraceae bacterium]|nr:FAD/NAD(P)-binding oxidoreductase [Rhodanobacteraceae bacterium]